RHYDKGKIPEDPVLNGDLEQLLKGYEQILDKRPADKLEFTQWWIFQGNPKFYDVDSAIHDLSELTWTVKQEATRASVGDRVFFWRAGREAGIIALGTITERASQRESLPTEEQYLLSPERLGGSQMRVLVRIDRQLVEPLRRTTIAAEPRLKDLV